MTPQTSRIGRLSEGGSFRPGRLVWLWLLVIFVGVQLGAGLYEKLAIIPLWADVPPDQVLDRMRTSGMWAAGRAFWPFVSPAVAVLAVVNLLVARRSPAAYRWWWLAGAALMVTYRRSATAISCRRCCCCRAPAEPGRRRSSNRWSTSGSG